MHMTFSSLSNFYLSNMQLKFNFHMFPCFPVLIALVFLNRMAAEFGALLGG